MRMIITLSGVALCTSLIVLFQIYHLPEAKQYRQKQAEIEQHRLRERDTMVLKAERELACREVGVFDGQFFTIEYRARTGVSTQEGIRQCGPSAFNSGKEAYMTSPSGSASIALGKDAVAVRRQTSIK